METRMKPKKKILREEERKIKHNSDNLDLCERNRKRSVKKRKVKKKNVAHIVLIGRRLHNRKFNYNFITQVMLGFSKARIFPTIILL